ncbi:MAG: protoporphyrinogen oxidase [Desulfovibrio sp.]|nr:protoporphyrinogen oxidase [Desulfovibrio sp.]
MRTLIALMLTLMCSVVTAGAEEHAFTLFSADLPDGWGGDEKEGFTFGEGGEGYMLILTCPGADGESIAAAVSLFVLPNIHHDDSATHAAKLAKLQENASAPRPDGPFWAFTGQPHSRSIDAPAVTRVNVTPEKALIAIVQDTGEHGAEQVFRSVRGLTDESRTLLGQ